MLSVHDASQYNIASNKHSQYTKMINSIMHNYSDSGYTRQKLIQKNTQSSSVFFLSFHGETLQKFNLNAK